MKRTAGNTSRPDPEKEKVHRVQFVALFSVLARPQ